MRILLSIILVAMLPCVLTISYDKKTLLDSASYTVGEPLEVSKAFKRLDELLGSSDVETSDYKSLTAKLNRVAETVELVGPEGEEIDQAIEILVDMVNMSGLCEFGGYLAMMRAYLSATYRADNSLEATLDPKSPTDKMVIKALKRHRQACLSQYSRKFPLVLGTMEPIGRVFAGKVDRFLSSDVLELMFPGEDLIARVKAIDIVPDRFIARLPRALFMKKLNEAARRTADRINLERDLSERDATRHLIDPCKSYVENYSDIFLPARLDLAVNENSKMWQVNPTGNREFEEAWIKFRVCSALAYDPKQTLNLINSKLSRD